MLLGQLSYNLSNKKVWKDNGRSILPSDPYVRAVSEFWVAYYDVKLVPLLKKLKSAQGEDRIAVKRRIDRAMKVLEEAFATCSKGKAYFGGDDIGYIDIAIGGCLGWIKAMEKVSGLDLIEEAKTPQLAAWAQRFMENDAVKTAFPGTEKYVGFLKMMEARAKEFSNFRLRSRL